MSPPASTSFRIVSDEAECPARLPAGGRDIPAAVGALRATLASLEARHAAEGRAPPGGTSGTSGTTGGKGSGRRLPPVPTGIADLDAVLGGGLRPGCVHEMWGPADGPPAAASGFALALAAALVAPLHAPSHLLWVWPKRLAQEAGLPYGPGLMAFGLDPGRILLVEAGSGLDVLWTVEEALAASLAAPLAAVIAFVDDTYEARAFTASRRFALAARTHGASALLIGSGASGFASAAPLRWQVGPMPADGCFPIGDTGHAGYGSRLDRRAFAPAPRWRVELTRNRFGATGTFDLVWDHHAGRLREARTPDTAAAPAGGRAPAGLRMSS